MNRVRAAWMAQVIKEDIEDNYRPGAVPGVIGRRRKPALTESQKRRQERDRLRYEKKESRQAAGIRMTANKNISTAL